MPSTDSEITLMEDPQAVGDKEGSLTDIMSSVSPPTGPSSTPLPPSTARQNFDGEAMIEAKAVSMASNDCSSSLSSPAEASPAKPTVTSPTTIDGTVETSPAASRIASASDSLTCTGTSLVNISKSSPPLPDLPSKTFGAPDPEADFPAVLTFEGISVSLENDSVWKQFHGCGTEMIITKPGRRMFPYCRYRVAGLDPNKQYSLVLSLAPSDTHKYRWATTKWEVQGPAENQMNLMRAFPHHLSPCRGSDWMSSLVSFYKLKLTNNPQDQDDHILLHSMHRYIPRLHVIPVPDGPESAAEPTVVGLESKAFTFPQTEFMAVTTYQNFRITQLKINHNPFAKGFRYEGSNTRLTKVTAAARPVIKMVQPPPFKPAELDKLKEEAVDVGISTPLSNKQETRLVLKPIMSSSGGNGKPYVPCIRGKHALGELMLVQKRPCLEPKEGTHPVGEMQKAQQDRVTPGEMSKTPTSTTSTPRSSPGYRKRRKRINRRWANSRGREWKTASGFPTVVHRPSSTVATQPELDDVEGLLFASFSSKEALQTHIRDTPASNASSASPVMTWMQLNQKVDVAPETDEEKMARLEAVLLQDLQVLKHRQVIHPVLQQVGLKLSSLDLTNSIDLRYLGVLLPLPPPQLPERGGATFVGEEGLAFISRTGKTSDITKIKGWRNKFIRKKEASPSNCDGPQKNLSAFCSNLLDKYLESEGQYISERAAAFSQNPEGPVAYQLPDKSSSYVKTLDSVLKQNAASKVPVAASRPCPLSHKPPSYSTLMSSAPPLADPATPEAQFRQQSASSHTLSEAALMANAASGLISQRGATQSQGMSHRPWNFTKSQLKLLQMEIGALNEGLSRTQLTPDRLNLSLSVILTKEMLPSQLLKTSSHHPKCQTEQPVCGQDFCRLGCVCSSLQQLNRGPLHCRRPECMFGCSCFKRKITKLLTAGEGEQQIEPIYSFTNMDHAVLPRVGSRAAKLWDCKIDHVDPEPLFTPKSAPLCFVPAKAVKRRSIPCPPPAVREEDKDPVYKYLESMMTCARVREFNSRPPPEVTLEPKIPDSSTPDASAKAEETAADNLPKMYYRTFQNHKTADNAPLGISSEEREARKQIEIQSSCQWKKDRKKVLEALFRRSKHDRLSKRFYIGPYRIRPVAKIFMKKPSGSLVTYRVNISQRSQASDGDESEDSDEEKHPNKSLDLEMDAEEEEDDQIEDPVMVAGVTPFLSKVLPAGILRAMTKQVGCKEAYGLVQVNNKFYNHARVLLGGIGSLHPANRLAAYITGRLHVPGGRAFNSSQKPDPIKKVNAPDALPVEGARAAVPPTTVARTTELKTPVQPPVQVSQPDSWRNGPTTLPQQSQRSSIPSPSNIAGSFQKGSATSNVSLTVSPSLKTPSFLEQSGTYSFRICPPDNQSTRGQNPPGVALPGGFTLIQLPKHGADGATQQPGSATSPSLTDIAQPSVKDLCNVGHLAADSDANLRGLDTFTRANDPLSGMSGEPGSSAALMCKERTDEKNKANPWKVGMKLVASSEDSSSDFSDNCGEDEMLVDIETVEEESQGLAINRLRKEAKIASMNSRDSSDDFGSARELGIQDQLDNEYSQYKVKRRRNIHSVLERQRRIEQRQLFDKLANVLQSDPKAPRLRLLSQARKEIQNLVESSEFMKEQKERLLRIQSFYVKKLSHLSGKSDAAVREKLRETYDRQKVKEKTKKWVPFYSQLLQSRAALLQDTIPQSMPQTTPVLPTDFCMNTPQPNAYTVAAQNSADQTRMPPPHALPLVVSSPAQVVVAAPSQQTEKQLGDPQAPAQVIMTNIQAVPQLQVSSGLDGNSPGFIPMKGKKSHLHPQHTLTLPLIRSKNGRLILPSTIRPCGQGYYTLMVMNPKQTGENGEANMQPPDVDLQKSLVKPDHPIEATHALEKNTTVPSLNSAPTHPGIKAPLVQLGHLNTSIFVPALAVAVTQNSQEGAALAPKTTATPSSGISPVPASAEPKSDGSPVVVRRGRGRPRKHPVVPGSENGKSTVGQASGKTVSDTETSVLVKGSQIEKSTSEATNGMVGENPMPVKRGRGRPPKNKQAKMCHESDGSPFPSNKNLDTRLKLSPAVIFDGDVKSSRPLTRGSLGKDFPSEKKRSWIDVEKELEPELESE